MTGTKRNKEMKVLVTGTRGIPNILGGIETHCEELMPRIAKKGVDITLTRRKGYAVDMLQEWEGIRLVDIYTPKLKGVEPIWHTFVSVLWAWRHGCNIVHIHAIGPGLITPLAKMFGMKVVVTHHSLNYEHEKWGWFAKMMLRAGEWCSMKWADEVVVISKAIKRIVDEKYNRKGVHLIPNGVKRTEIVNDEEYLKELGLEKRGYVLGLGRFVPEKNIDHLVEAYKKAFPKANESCGNVSCGRRIKLVLAGEATGADESVRKIVVEAEKEGVIMPGFVRGEKLKCLLSNARCFVLPSSHEGMSIALLEAMSYGLPVIVSDIAANKDMGLPEECYFKLGDIEQLSNKLKRNADDEFSMINYNMKEYDWDDIAEKTFEVYRECMKS